MPEQKFLPSLLVFGFLACVSPDEGLDDLTLLSGTWYGTQDIYQVGSCTLNGEEHVRSDEIFRIDVLSTGFMEVTDSATNVLVFRGVVDEDLKVNLDTWYSVNCPGQVTHSDSATHEGRFEIHADYYELNTSATEIWCPPDCAFDVIYRLTKNI